MHCNTWQNKVILVTLTHCNICRLVYCNIWHTLLGYSNDRTAQAQFSNICCVADWCVVTSATSALGGALTGQLCSSSTCPLASAGSICYGGGDIACPTDLLCVLFFPFECLTARTASVWMTALQSAERFATFWATWILKRRQMICWRGLGTRVDTLLPHFHALPVIVHIKHVSLRQSPSTWSCCDTCHCQRWKGSAALPLNLLGNRRSSTIRGSLKSQTSTFCSLS